MREDHVPPTDEGATSSLGGAATQTVSTKFDYMPGVALDILTNTATVPGALVRGMAGIIARMVPKPNVVTMILSGSFAESVQGRRSGSSNAIPFSDLRGSNVAVAKTMKVRGNEIHVVVNAEHLFGDEDDTPEKASGRINRMLHLAAHEAVHVLHHQRGESAEEIFNRAQIESATEEYFALEAGTVLEEYRAQLTAERIFPLSDPFLSTFESDLEAYSRSTVAARALSKSDMPAAARMQLSGVTNLWKGLAFISAENRLGRSVPPSILSSENWIKFVGPSWAATQAVFQTLPPGDTAADMTRLCASLRQLSQLLQGWFLMVGLEYVFDQDDRAFLFWTDS
jgi:hypothetical protein